MKYIRKIISYYLIFAFYIITNCFIINQVWGSRCHSIDYFLNADYWLGIIYPKGLPDTELMWLISVLGCAVVGCRIFSAKSFIDEIKIFVLSIVPIWVASLIGFTALDIPFSLFVTGNIFYFIFLAFIFTGLMVPPFYIIIIPIP